MVDSSASVDLVGRFVAFSTSSLKSAWCSQAGFEVLIVVQCAMDCRHVRCYGILLVCIALQNIVEEQRCNGVDGSNEALVDKSSNTTWAKHSCSRIQSIQRLQSITTEAVVC